MDFERITVEPGTMGGQPCIRGYRLTVAHVVRLVAAGRSVEEIQSDFRFVQAEDIRQALSYAAEAVEGGAHVRRIDQDLLDAVLVLSRALTDGGRRTSLDEVLASFGLTRKQLESSDWHGVVEGAQPAYRLEDADGR